MLVVLLIRHVHPDLVEEGRVLEELALAGAEAVQLFDTWAGVLPPDQARANIAYMREMMSDQPARAKSKSARKTASAS